MSIKRTKSSKNGSAPKSRKQSSNDTNEDTSAKEYTVHAIRNHTGRPGFRKFLVSWVGYKDEDTWVEEKILQEDVPHKLIAYLQRKKISTVADSSVMIQ